MTGASSLGDIFAAVMIIVATYSAGRLVASRLWLRPTHVDIDVMHVLMGVAMAGMLVAALNPIPSRVWEVVFSGLAAWFLWRCYAFVAEHGVAGRDEDPVHNLSHYVTHVVMAFAMLYMYLAATAPSAGSMSGGMARGGGATGATADFVGLPLLFLMVLLASGIWELDGAERFALSRSLPTERVPSVALARANRSAMASGGDATIVAFRDGAHDASGSRTESAPWLAPGLKAASHIAMCIIMGYMLIVML